MEELLAAKVLKGGDSTHMSAEQKADHGYLDNTRSN